MFCGRAIVAERIDGGMAQRDRLLEGSVALVTGASSGIGEATVRSLAAQGAAIAATARRLDRLEDLAGEVRGLGRQALAIESDIGEPGRAIAIVDQTVETLGRLDILINNAGVMYLGPLEDASIGEVNRMIDVNLRGLIHTTRAALPHLILAAESATRACADVVNVSSVAGRVAGDESGAYSATKFGVGAFTESLRQEMVGRRVRAMLIEPGTVDTELITHVRSGVRERALAAVSGVRRLDAVDIANAIAFAVTRPWHVSMNEILIRPTEEHG